LSVRYGDLLYARVFGDSGSNDLVGASSGRTEIWTTAIAAMVREPMTLLTGFGWDVYWTMPFRYSPHNHYLALWFNLGIVGLVCGVMLLAIVVREARAGVDRAQLPEYQAATAAFLFGTLAIAVATLFVDLYMPWLWFWAYAGLVMRIVVDAKSAERTERERAAPRAASPYGWAASPSSTQTSMSERMTSPRSNARA
jgi:O-antigen ligase